MSCWPWNSNEKFSILTLEDLARSGEEKNQPQRSSPATSDGTTVREPRRGGNGVGHAKHARCHKLQRRQESAPRTRVRDRPPLTPTHANNASQSARTHLPVVVSCPVQVSASRRSASESAAGMLITELHFFISTYGRAKGQRADRCGGPSFSVAEVRTLTKLFLQSAICWGDLLSSTRCVIEALHFIDAINEYGLN